MIKLSIGRGETCDIRVDDQYASPLHATLTLYEDGRMLVRDEGSTNGTRIVGERERVYGPRTVGRHDRLLIGRTILAVADLVAAAARMVPRG